MVKTIACRLAAPVARDADSQRLAVLEPVLDSARSPYSSTLDGVVSGTPYRPNSCQVDKRLSFLVLTARRKALLGYRDCVLNGALRVLIAIGASAT